MSAQPPHFPDPSFPTVTLTPPIVSQPFPSFSNPLLPPFGDGAATTVAKHTMQSRPADERPSRLSLVPLIRDLDVAAAEQPDDTGSKSHMDWDDSPPRAHIKVSQRVRDVFQRKREERAVGLDWMAAADQVVRDTPQPPSEGTSNVAQEKRVCGSVASARAGIESRVQEEVIPLTPAIASHTDILTGFELAKLRRAHVPKRFRTAARASTHKFRC